MDWVKFNKPGTLPLETSTEVKDECPLDCGLCTGHKQNMCLALFEVNSACNLNCPICFANAGVGFSLTMDQVEFMLDRFVETEGDPEVIQFGGAPAVDGPLERSHELVAKVRSMVLDGELGYWLFVCKKDS